MTAIICYLKKLNNRGEFRGDFRDTFVFTNERGFERGTITAQAGPEVIKGTVKINGKVLPVELHIGFVNEQVSSMYTAFDLKNTAWNHPYDVFEKTDDRIIQHKRREVVIHRPNRTYRNPDGSIMKNGMAQFPVLRIRQKKRANRIILMGRLFDPGCLLENAARTSVDKSL